jgi:hypothetical protein
MKKQFANFKSWCNVNGGFLAFLAILVAIIFSIWEPRQINNIDFDSVKTIWSVIQMALLYVVKIPVYFIILITFIWFLYWSIFKRRYKSHRISMDFLVGSWKNEWIINGQNGSEICQIQRDGKYFVKGKHCFTLDNFSYDYKSNTITFSKISVLSGDNRTLPNELNVNNNDLISGFEDQYKIKYTRIK